MKRISHIKAKIVTVVVIFAAVALAGCKKEIVPPAISLSRSAVYVDWDTHAIPLTVETNSEWSATSNKEWCRLSISYGRTSQQISVLVDESSDDEVRTAIVTFKTKGGNPVSTALIVSQAGEPVWVNNQ